MNLRIMLPSLFGGHVLAAALVGGLAFTQTYRDEPRSPGSQDPNTQHVDGVVEEVGAAGDEGEMRIRINDAAVWRDYVRDTATTEGSSVEKAAQKGKQGIAAKGQPEDANTIVEVRLDDKVEPEVRYRTEMDESSLGAASADEARKLAKSDPGSVDTQGKRLDRSRLKAGLFVHVVFGAEENGQRVRRLIILEPVRDEAAKP